MTNYLLKRAYSPAEASDGYRVYIDRLWPRGLSHETFQYDLWEKEISPSTELREWFHAAGDAAWPQFEKRYTEELAANPIMPKFIAELSQHRTVTLLYSSHDETQYNAIVLRDYIIAHQKENPD